MGNTGGTVLGHRPCEVAQISFPIAEAGAKNKSRQGQGNPRRDCIRPPPSPHFLARRHFSGEGSGGVYFEAPRGRNFIRPPLSYVPPTHRSYAAPVGAFLCPEFRAFSGFGVRFLRQSLVTIKYNFHPKMANSR